MSLQHDRSVRRHPAVRALRWAALVAATSGALALLALAGRSATGTGSEAAGPLAAPAPPADAARDPGLRLGAEFAPLGPTAVQSLGLAPGSALTVVAVRPDSQAARAGLQPRDIVTAITGPAGPGTASTPTINATWEALCAALDERPSGGALDFFVRRDGRTRIVHVTLAPLDESARDLAHAPEPLQTACV